MSYIEDVERRRQEKAAKCCFAALSDRGRETVIVMRPHMEARESEIAQLMRVVLASEDLTMLAQLDALMTLEAMPEIQ